MGKSDANSLNPDRSKRKMVRSPPPPPSNLQYGPYTNNTLGAPLKVTGSTMRTQQGDSRSDFIQQKIQESISMSTCWFPRRSQAASGPVETSLVPHTLQSTPPPPGSPISPLPSENSRKIVPSSSEGNKLEEEEEEEKDTSEASMHQLTMDALQHYAAFGQIVGIMASSYEKKKDGLRRSNDLNKTLKEQIEEQTGTIKALQEKVDLLNDNIEDLQKKAQNDIQKAKAEGMAHRDNYMKLQDQHTALKSESVKDKQTIESLTEKVKGHVSKISGLEGRVKNFENSERQLKKQLEDRTNYVEWLKTKVHEEEIKVEKLEAKVQDLEASGKKLKAQLEDKSKKFQVLDEKYKKKCTQFSKLNQDFENLKTTNNALVTKVDNLVMKDYANRATIQNLETQITNLKQSIKELEAIISENSKEISRISQDLEKNKNDVQLKVAEVKNKDIKIKSLKKTIMRYHKEQKKLPVAFDALSQQLRNTLFSDVQTKVVELSDISSCSEEEETSPPTESSSSSSRTVDGSNTVNVKYSKGGEPEKLESQQANLGGKRKLMEQSSPEKNKRSVNSPHRK